MVSKQQRWSSSCLLQGPTWALPRPLQLPGTCLLAPRHTLLYDPGLCHPALIIPLASLEPRSGQGGHQTQSRGQTCKGPSSFWRRKSGHPKAHSREGRGPALLLEAPARGPGQHPGKSTPCVPPLSTAWPGRVLPPSLEVEDQGPACRATGDETTGNLLSPQAGKMGQRWKERVEGQRGQPGHPLVRAWKGVPVK